MNHHLEVPVEEAAGNFPAFSLLQQLMLLSWPLWEAVQLETAVFASYNRICDSFGCYTYCLFFRHLGAMAIRHLE